MNHSGTITGRWSTKTDRLLPAAQVAALTHRFHREVTSEKHVLGLKGVLRDMGWGPFRVDEIAGGYVYIVDALDMRAKLSILGPAGMGGPRLEKLAADMCEWINQRHCEWLLARGTPAQETLWLSTSTTDRPRP